MDREEKVVDVGWVSLSKSGKSLTIRVLDQLFFVSLRDLDSVLKGYRNRVDVKQWVEQRRSGRVLANEYLGREKFLEEKLGVEVKPDHKLVRMTVAR